MMVKNTAVYPYLCKGQRKWNGPQKQTTMHKVFTKCRPSYFAPAEPGTWLEVNNGKNPKFFGKYQVGAAGDEMGMVRIELGRFAQ